MEKFKFKVRMQSNKIIQNNNSSTRIDIHY